MDNKRKVFKAKTLQGKYIKYKNVKKEEVSTEVVTPVKVEMPKPNPVTSFKLVVVKLPWYKKVIRSIKNFFGFGYF